MLARYRHYGNVLAACPVHRDEYGKVGYLTIQESITAEEGATQRRHGLHTETPGRIRQHLHDDLLADADVGGEWTKQDNVPLTIAWGRGFYGTFVHLNSSKTKSERGRVIFWISCLLIYTYAPWGCIIRADEQTKSN